MLWASNIYRNRTWPAKCDPGWGRIWNCDHKCHKYLNPKGSDDILAFDVYVWWYKRVFIKLWVQISIVFKTEFNHPLPAQHHHPPKSSARADPVRSVLAMSKKETKKIESYQFVYQRSNSFSDRRPECDRNILESSAFSASRLSREGRELMACSERDPSREAPGSVAVRQQGLPALRAETKKFW